METETCTYCLKSILFDLYEKTWVHLDSDEPECDPADSDGTVATPR